MSSLVTAVPRVVLKPRRALPFFHRHPWVFDTALDKCNESLAPGDEVLLATKDGQPVARGLYNPHSKIRIRLYSWDVQSPLDSLFWKSRLTRAIQLRRVLAPAPSSSTAERLVFSEADGLSGLTVDRYGDWLSVQFTSLALWARRELFLEHLRELCSPKGILLRTERGMRAAEGLEASDGLAWGDDPPRPLMLVENGLQFAVDLQEGQKTGFFLDQRENRALLNPLVKNRRVLDAFCYSGGFSLNAAVHGQAAHVTAVDVSEAALELAKRNAELNGAGERIDFVKQDAFKALEGFVASGTKFHAVVLDPPKMARRREAVEAALKGYYSLNRLGIQVLEPGGWLLTCSCSGLVTREMFEETLAKAAVHAGRDLQVVRAAGPAPDHPASLSCPENEYLKCYLCRVN